MGEGLAEGLTGGLANLPTWVWYLVVVVIFTSFRPWENMEGIPRWVWIVVVVLAIWVLITGK